MNLLGEFFFKSQYSGSQETKIRISSASWKAGVYIVQIQINKELEILKVVKQ